MSLVGPGVFCGMDGYLGSLGCMVVLLPEYALGSYVCGLLAEWQFAGCV